MNGARHLHLATTAPPKREPHLFASATGILWAFLIITGGIGCVAVVWHLRLVPAASERIGNWVDHNIGPLVTPSIPAIRQ